MFFFATGLTAPWAVQPPLPCRSPPPVGENLFCNESKDSAPKGKWRNAPKGVFRFFHNYERLATVFTPLTLRVPSPSGGEYPPALRVPSPGGGEYPLTTPWFPPPVGENLFCDESKDSAPKGKWRNAPKGVKFFT